MPELSLQDAPFLAQMRDLANQLLIGPGDHLVFGGDPSDARRFAQERDGGAGRVVLGGEGKELCFVKGFHLVVHLLHFAIAAPEKQVQAG